VHEKADTERRAKGAQAASENARKPRRRRGGRALASLNLSLALADARRHEERMDETAQKLQLW